MGAISVIIAAWCILPTLGQVNRAPQFLPNGDMSRFSLREDTPVGTSVYTLQGVDPENQTIDYSISGDNLSVNRATGIVTLVRPLDREAEDVLDVIVTVSDSDSSGSDPNVVSVRRQIQILDVNDNKPEFHGVPYSFKVPEDAPVGTNLFRGINVSDADAGSNADLRLMCDEKKDPEACNKFELRFSRVGEGRFLGTVKLRRKLDFEERSSYNVPIIVFDQGSEIQRTSEISILAEVIDLQDQPPVFKHAPYSIVVPENLPPNSPVLDFEVQDGDSGDWRKLELSISSDPRQYFALEMRGTTESGVHRARLVTTSNQIDREDPANQDGVYTVQIKATEVPEDGSRGESTLTTVSVIVEDADDQLPVFNLNQVELIVPEHVGDGVALPGLDLLVTDADELENAEFTLRLESVLNSDGVFGVFPARARGKAAVQVNVQNSAALDFENPEKREFVFRIVAVPVKPSLRSGELPSATIRVRLSDTNDNDPVFEEKKFVFDVPEDAKPGELIAQIEATDADSGEFGVVRYRIQGFGAEKFSVNNVTGQLYVGECGLPTCLDYESRREFALTLIAVDGGKRQATISVRINVVDVNDNAPVFEIPEYRRAVDEGESVFKPPLIVKAKDADGGDSGNGRVFYSIVSGNTDDEAFFLEPVSGELTATRPLSGSETDTGRFRLTIEARDGGEEPRTARTNVVITVGTEGNDRPLFRSGPYDARVKEDVAPGVVLLQLSTHDPDGDDTAIRYSLISGGHDNFNIHPISGEISVAPQADLDKEKNGDSYVLTIHAIDGGAPVPQTGTTTVSITVDDVNDESPKFSRPHYSEFVSESTPVGTEVVRLSAVDADENAALAYSLIEGRVTARDQNGLVVPREGNYDVVGAFRVDAKTGGVQVNKPLDHGSAAIIVLSVMVEDSMAEKGPQNDTAEVTIYVQALNSDNPAFESPWTAALPFLNVSIDEEPPLGAVVARLTATDPLLSGAVVSTYEKVPESDPEGYFQVAASTGTVVTARRIDFDTMADKSPSLQVKAIAADGIRSSIANVMVTILDVNDNSPDFVEPVASVSVPEDTLPLRPIFKVKARDADSQNGYGDVRYVVEGPSRDVVRVNGTTGEVYVKDGARLDRETGDKMNVTVVAYDTPQGGPLQRRTRHLVTMTIEDVNDNAPVFSRASYEAVVAENVPVGTSFFQVEATDRDSGASGQVRYSLVSTNDGSNYFDVTPDTGMIFVDKTLAGKGRREPYTLTIRAIDGGAPPLFSEVRVALHIGDVASNDGVPYIKKPASGEIAYVAENAPAGTPVYQVVADDPDDSRSENGRLLYSLFDSYKKFRIDPATGLIVTVVELDREDVDTYTLVIVVKDNGTPQQLTSKDLIVRVSDEDDHVPVFPPQFKRAPLVFHVKEEVPVGTVVGRVHCVDEDIGENANVAYRLIGGSGTEMIQVDTTPDHAGLLVVKSRLDRETIEEFDVAVQCLRGSAVSSAPKWESYDAKEPSHALVRIVVDDIDDNSPSFVNGNTTVGVRPNTPRYTEIVRLRAADVDSLAAPVEFRLTRSLYVNLKTGEERNASDVFVVRGRDRVLTVASLEPFSGGMFELSVTASNGEGDGQKDTAIVKVYVLPETRMLRFVFKESPRELQSHLDQFVRDLEAAIEIPVALNLLDAEYVSREDGTLDVSRSTACFHVIGQEGEVYPMPDAKFLLDAGRLDTIRPIYDRYKIDAIQDCAPPKKEKKRPWVEYAVMGVGGLIVFTALITALAVCCLMKRYRRKQKKLEYERMRQPAYEAGNIYGPVRPPSVAPSVLSADPRHQFEWHPDAMSHQSFSHA